MRLSVTFYAEYFYNSGPLALRQQRDHGIKIGESSDEALRYLGFSAKITGEAAKDVAAVTDDGTRVSAAIRRGNVYGCQFHPEKGGEAGLHLLKKFGEPNRWFCCLPSTGRTAGPRLVERTAPGSLSGPPVVIRDIDSKEVLVVGYTNREALERTLVSKTAWFWSRSLKFRNKGETSGHDLRGKAIRYDCDCDTLRYLCQPLRPTCHTGHPGCFYRVLEK